ncbi:hypothetical protein PsorP6_011588 [Peronosclerospora sorghi]|uniref:Uncharacterized protein n=1 Tax=Peronosclerospora sorghi TaxID=230839 RepID=A0ACC0WJX8_9STRA|nr:hypothetical protein PsorP6_011588 [Peronosclerospora sorghi]
MPLFMEFPKVQYPPGLLSRSNRVYAWQNGRPIVVVETPAHCDARRRWTSHKSRVDTLRYFLIKLCSPSTRDVFTLLKCKTRLIHAETNRVLNGIHCLSM